MNTLTHILVYRHVFQNEITQHRNLYSENSIYVISVNSPHLIPNVRDHRFLDHTQILYQPNDIFIAGFPKSVTFQ